MVGITCHKQQTSNIRCLFWGVDKKMKKQSSFNNYSSLELDERNAESCVVSYCLEKLQVFTNKSFATIEHHQFMV